MAGRQRQAAGLQALQREHRVGRVLQRKADLEQRIAAQIAARGELLDQLLEGDVLLRVGGEGAFAHSREQLAKRRRVRQAHAQHQRVGEKSDQPLELGAPAPGDRRAHHNILDAAVAMQQHLECRQ